jgi:DNA-directed RNA polymerase
MGRKPKQTSADRSRAKTEGRYSKRNRKAWGENKHSRHYIEVPEGKRVFDDVAPALVAYLRTQEPPGNLADAINQLDDDSLAKAALTLLDVAMGGCPDTPATVLETELRAGEALRDRLALADALRSDGVNTIVAKIVEATPDSRKGRRLRGKLAEMAKSDDPAARSMAERISSMPIKRGRRPKDRYMDFLKPDWTQTELQHAGKWLVDAIMLGTNLFSFDDDFMPTINPELAERIEQLREELRWRDPVLMPHTEPPPEWTGWRASYGDRLSKTLVRDWRPETRREIESALSDRRTVYSNDDEELELAAAGDLPPGFIPAIEPIGTEPGPFVAQHLAAVNRLQRVPLRIDLRMVELVREFGSAVLKPDYDSLLESDEPADQIAGKKLRRQHKRDTKAIIRECADARWLTKQNGPGYLSYSLDRRGRVYANQHLNFGREDHIRALFRFDRELPLGDDGRSWLEIHCANCYGERDKAAWGERIQWARDHRPEIERIAADPAATFDLWRGADKPFAYIAACIELARAWADPLGFKTGLPVSFDGSANGIQHLALMMRDRSAAKLVNLVNTDEPQDVYAAVITLVVEKIEADDSEHAAWWRARLAACGNKTKRKLIKTPAMAFAYSITPVGMADEIRKVFKDKISRRKDEQPSSDAVMFLVSTIRKTCKKLLPGPAKAMAYIRKLATHAAADGRFLAWAGATGMLVTNRYHVPNKPRIRSGGSRHFLPDGATTKMDVRKLVDASAPNLAHSMDAAHLARVVNSAAEWDIEVLTVHDSFSCLAPQAKRLNQVLRVELAKLYSSSDLLAALRRFYVKGDTLPLPERGDFDPAEVQFAEYCFA